MESPMEKLSPLQMAKYLVCVDGREESRIGLQLACMKANARGCRVAMLHVTAPADFQTLGSVADLMREERRREGQALLDGLAEVAYATYGIKPIIMLREGSTGDEIVAAALEDLETNMVVLGIAQQTSGRGKLAAWLAGQLGSKLFIPILMVPGNLTDQQLQSLI
jgi:nucleotide-binding universal stress UspA family protein